jgi:riboflavin kinase/FMN adenylyltransferase
MQIINDINSNRITHNTGVGLGSFDGLHIGHMALINTLISECRLNCLNSVVFTFSRHPDYMLKKHNISPLITTNEQKNKILASTDLDCLIYQDFSESFSKLSPDEFVKQILIDKLKARLVVIGFNYRYGHMGKGNAETMKRSGNMHGFRVIVVPPVKVNSEIVSSTLIREYIRRGNIERVFQLLGRHFSLYGTVEQGRRVGRTLGFPTANIEAHPEMVIPARGVYITKTLFEGKWYNGVTNVGIAPTVRNKGSLSIETHLLDYNGDLYGKDIEVCFIHKLRGEKRFNNIDSLKKQVLDDIKMARSYWQIFRQ